MSLTPLIQVPEHQQHQQELTAPIDFLWGDFSLSSAILFFITTNVSSLSSCKLSYQVEVLSPASEVLSLAQCPGVQVSTINIISSYKEKGFYLHLIPLQAGVELRGSSCILTESSTKMDFQRAKDFCAKVSYLCYPAVRMA